MLYVNAAQAHWPHCLATVAAGKGEWLQNSTAACDLGVAARVPPQVTVCPMQMYKCTGDGDESSRLAAQTGCMPNWLHPSSKDGHAGLST